MFQTNSSSSIRNAGNRKDVDVLNVSAAMIRRLNGGRVVFCKSGKDRTAMGVTLEQARLLVAYHGFGSADDCSLSTVESSEESHLLSVANILREYGVRIDVGEFF
jgi:hypothetical protein